MKYLVTVTKEGRLLACYPGIGNAFDLHAAAIDTYGPCSVSVLRQQ